MQILKIRRTARDGARRRDDFRARTHTHTRAIYRAPRKGHEKLSRNPMKNCDENHVGTKCVRAYARAHIYLFYRQSMSIKI